MKIIFKYLKRFILGGFMLYAYNLIAVTFTIITVGLLDIPGLMGLVALKILML